MSAGLAGVRAAIVGIAGPELAAAERDRLAACPPLGFILFGRNCHDRETVRRLVAELRDCLGRADAPILIDQEGGRVVRLQPPAWRSLPPARRIGELAEADPESGLEAAWLVARLIADDLAGLGIDVDCAPVLDVPVAGAHDVIGDRAFARDPELVAALGRAFMRGLREGGVQPVIKHLPGHGRARADSHLELPVVGAERALLVARDLVPFRACRDAPYAMTAHVVYTAFDPVRPATLSATVIEEVVRRLIGFEGVLMTDDISMKALSGTVAERAERALEAGCDLVLHCNGALDEAREVLEAAPPLEGARRARIERALAERLAPRPFDPAVGAARLDDLLCGLGAA